MLVIDCQKQPEWYVKLCLGLCVDWRDGNVYWSEGTSAGSISVMSQTTRDSYVLISDDLINPSALVIVPLQKWVKYTNTCARNVGGIDKLKQNLLHILL